MGLFDWLIGKDSRPPFVIKVAAMQDEENLAPENLCIFHAACGGGVMETHLTDSWLWLTCTRCRVNIHIEGGEHGIGAIYNTARDGTERWLRGGFHEGISEYEYRGIIVHKE
jgi:hypothetical protein